MKLLISMATTDSMVIGRQLRFGNISTIESANAYVPKFVEAFNAKFAKQPRNGKDVHRPLARHDNLDNAMCVKAERTVSNSLTLLYDKVMFILEPSDITAELSRKRVTVCDYPVDRLEIELRHDGSLPARVALSYKYAPIAFSVWTGAPSVKPNTDIARSR